MVLGERSPSCCAAGNCSATGELQLAINCSLVSVGDANSTQPADGAPASAAVTGATVVTATALAVIAVLSALGNTMVLFVIFKHLKFKTVTNAFITTLSISDLLTTFICMPMSLTTVIHGRWVFDDAGCVAHGTMSATFSVVSTVMLAFITVDRYFVVVKLPKKPLAVTSALLAITATWCAAFVVSAPWYLLVPRNHGNTSLGWVPYKTGYRHCMYVFHVMGSHYPGPAYSSVYILLCYALPVGCMVFCSVCLWRIIHHNDSRIRPSSTPVSQLRFNGEMRTAKTVVVMVILFVLTRIPYILAGVLCAMIGSPASVAWDTGLLWLFWSNCAVNPVIYAFRNPTVAQLLRLGRRSGYETENPAVPDFRPPSIANPRDIAGEFLTPRQCKYLPSSSGVQAAAVDIADIADNCAAGKDARSDSIPSVLLFRTSSSLRKGSGFSTITSSTNTTTM